MILVTGATGFVGRSLMARLAREEIAARAYNGRINNPLALRQQLQDVDIVIHLAGAEARGRRRLLNHVDIDGSARLLEECRRAGVQKIIYLSRIGADPASLHQLLWTKGIVERQIQKSGIPYTILRAASLYGRGDRFFEMIVALAIWSWPFVWLPGGGTTPFQPLWVEDLTRCTVAALRRPDLQNKIITVVGEERLHYRLLAQTLLDAAGLKRLPLSLPLILLGPLTTLFFRWWYWPPVTRYGVDRFFVPEIAEIDSVFRSFGFRPHRVRDTISYLNRPGLRWRLFRR